MNDVKFKFSVISLFNQKLRFSAIFTQNENKINMDDDFHISKAIEQDYVVV